MRCRLQAYVFVSFMILSTHSAIFSVSKRTQENSFKLFQQGVDAIEDALNGFTVEEVSFEVQKNDLSKNTFLRKGFLAVRDNAVGTVIICHGYTQSKNESFFLKTMFSHFNVLAFDFRAHGELIDKDEYSTIGRDEVFDVKGAVDFVRSHAQLQSKPIIGFGFSMGAVSLLQAQAKFQNLFDMLILDSPFDSSNDCLLRTIDKMLTCKLFGRTYKLPGKKLIMKAMYSEKMRPFVNTFFTKVTGMNPHMVSTKFVPVVPIDIASQVKVPCFFISCEKDTSVRVECVGRLYAAVQSPFKRMWVTQGAKHCGSCLAQPEMYMLKVNKFIKEVMEHDFSTQAEVMDDRVTIKAM